MATLELLPFQFSESNPLAIQDESLLNLSFEGQLYEEKPGDIGRGEPITILNSKGEPVAIAYTNDSGKFRFTKLDPQLNYVMRLSEQTEAKHAIITAKGNKIDIPVLNAEVNYTRIAAEDAITLVNEFNDTIQVSPEDLFVINRIYYAFNSALLTSESRRQLEQLAIILERNTEINLELRAHTDARGDADYNLRLSQQRAKSAIQYLVDGGLSGLRFQYEGLGESQPLNECVDGVSCSEPEYAINRRTEIRLKRSSGMAISNR
jgi:outer membrane protein OmpA-like peptidoglycan-associated protein